jgi:hypothetical protein
MDVHAAARIFNILLAIGGLIVLWTALVTLQARAKGVRDVICDDRRRRPGGCGTDRIW